MIVSDRPPPDAEVEWQAIAPEARTFWIVGASLVIVPLTLIAIAAFVANDAPIGAAVALAIGAVAWGWCAFVIGRRWRSWAYAEREGDLLIRRGVLIRRLTVVPYGRMQFVDVTQGPLDRRFGLSTVTLHTAAARSDASIPLLRTEEAHRLRDRLVALGDARAAGL